ncbi:flippase-like domain-containing protein [Candidatus Microgenomates bacterium]|nr:flippase-like domain-containing protein [Candidatus Microgenomates bacterium]
MSRRYWLVALALLGVGALVYLIRSELAEAFHLLNAVSLSWLLLLPLTQISVYYARTRYYQSFLAGLGYRVGFRKMMQLALAALFVNQVSPTAGVSGTTLLSYGLRSHQVPAGQVTLVEYARFILTHTSYVVLLVAAAGWMYFTSNLDQIVMRILLLIVGVGVIVDVIIIVAMTTKKQINSIVRFGQRAIDWVSHWFRRNQGPLIGVTRVNHLLDEFHQSYDAVSRDWRKLVPPLSFTLLANLMEVMTLFIVFLALQVPISPAQVIISYAVANFAGAISLVPGDVGVYEVAMVAALSGTGVPVAVALSATLLYRVINKAMSLSLGFVCYTRFVQTLPVRQQQAIKGDT